MNNCEYIENHIKPSDANGSRQDHRFNGGPYRRMMAI